MTEKPQLAVWPSLEFAVTDTGVVPTGNELPEAGEPVTVTGATPPDVVAEYVTTTGDPDEDVVEIFAGQLRSNAGICDPEVAATFTPICAAIPP